MLGPSPTLGSAGPEQLTGLTNAPIDASSMPSASPGESKLPFSGLRVLDLTAFWAGPVVGHYLGIFGADVVHVESPTRLDNMRGHSVRPPDHERWWEYSPPFQATNTNKRGASIDLSTEGGRDLLLRLVEQADVVCENMTPRVLERFRLTFADLSRVNKRIVLLRMPAFGTAGPWRDRGGYAQTMEQISGLAWRTGYPEVQPEIPNGPCDPIAGMHATVALLLALEHRLRTGKGMEVEVAMVGGALNVAAEQVVEFTATGRRLERLGNRSRDCAPQGVYPLGPAHNDEWVALSVQTEAQWSALCDYLGSPGWAADDRYSSAAGRHQNHDSIDAHLGAWFSHLCRGDIEQIFAEGRIPIAPVLMPHQQTEVAQLAQRGFFEEVTHDLSGTSLFAKHPVRLGNGPTTHNRVPAPTLGQHTRELLVDWLAMSEPEICELEAHGIIGTMPRAAIHAR
jgi:crotonobetainyl-CoA:carnitine CoA-transferase CaiB-like acyl-CoA transferase